jgi:hypothetical protein
MPDQIDPPEVEFFMLDPTAPAPVPASETANGSLPFRANQFCPPVTDASGFGWYLFPPTDFALRWDGQETEVARLEASEPIGWRSLAGGTEVPLDGGLEQLGELADLRRDEIKETFRDHADLLITADADPRAMNQVELVIGPIVRTSPGWSTLVRSAPNLPHPGYEVMDGVIETDWYRSTLLVIVRLVEPGRVVRFYRHLPMAAMQVVPKVAYRQSTTRAARVVRGAGAIPDDVWDEFIEIAGARSRHERPGNYKLAQRRQLRVPLLSDTAMPSTAAAT